MAKTFDIVMPWVAEYEGGYVNHPEDPGGATNRGVTQRNYNAYRASLGLPSRDVRKLTDDEHDAIYKREYWDKMRCDGLPAGVDAAVFDFGVNSGPARSAKYLQRIVGATADGVIGVQTLAAVQTYVMAHSAQRLIIRLCNDRMAFLRRLRHFKTFGRGWTRRVMGQNDGVQDDDIGIIDRATVLAAMHGRRNNEEIRVNIPKPKATAQGKASARSMRSGSRLWEAFGAFFETFRGKAD